MSVDTLTIARNLRAAEVPPAQAEAIAAEIGQALGEGAANRGDVAAIIARLDASDARLAAQLDALEQRLAAKVETVRSSMLIWLIGILIAGAGLLTTIGRVYFR